MVYLYLAIAIIAEVTATSALKATEEFTKLIPSVIVVAGYVTSFYFLTIVLRTMSVGVAYAIWSGYRPGYINCDTVVQTNTRYASNYRHDIYYSRCGNH